MHEVVEAVGAVLLPIAGGAFATSWAWLRWRASSARRRAASLGAPAPAFGGLEGVDGRRHDLDEFADARLLVLVFMSNRCPGVKAYDARLAELAFRLASRGVRFIGLNPVDPGLYPSESMSEMKTAARERELPFPYLQDAGAEVARRYGAVATPQVFVLDARRRLRYRGRIDDAFVSHRVRRRYLEDALDDLLEGRPVRLPETAPLGCGFEGAATAGSYSGAAPETPSVT